MVRHVQDRRSVSQRRACQALGVSRSTQRYQGREDTDEEQRLVARMHELVRAYPRYGYRFIGAKLRQVTRAFELEHALNKHEILSLYLTLAPYGGNLEGIRAASLSYFGKEPRREPSGHKLEKRRTVTDRIGFDNARYIAASGFAADVIVTHQRRSNSITGETTIPNRSVMRSDRQKRYHENRKYVFCDQHFFSPLKNASTIAGSN